MLDLGSDVNILPKKTWEALGKPRLTYSPIQLRMENQYCIFPIGRLENVEIDVAGVKTVADFEVIEIMGDKDPYPALLGIDWAYDNYAVIDLKKDTMTFEAEGIKVVQPLDPYVGPRYTEPTDNNMEGEDLDQLYTVTAGTRNDYINPTVDGSVSWRSIQSADEDSELAFDSWQQGLHEIFSRRCTTIRMTRWVGTEVREHPIYDGTSDLDNFLQNMEETVGEDQRISVLDIAFQNTPARWWATHKAALRTWDEVKQALKYRFWNREQLESKCRWISTLHNCSVENQTLGYTFNSAWHSGRLQRYPLTSGFRYSPIL
jgi:hypothetical protein